MGQDWLGLLNCLTLSAHKSVAAASTTTQVNATAPGTWSSTGSMGLLGHSNIKTTADIYTHLLPAVKKQAAEKMHAILTGR